MKRQILCLLFAIVANISLSNAAIVIDGDFSDWATISANALAEARVSPDAVLEDLYDIKFCSSAEYAYFYIEYNGGEGVVGVLDMFINTDDEASTGHDDWLWMGSGADILLDGTIGIDDNGKLMWQPEIFKSLSNSSDWKWDALDAAGALKLSEIKTLANGNKAFEGSITRAALPNLTSFKVGVLAMAPEWAGKVGALPATVIGNDGSNIVPPMLDVPVIENLDGIKSTIDGINYILNGESHVAVVASGEYSGNLVIPSQVTYEHQTYAVTKIRSDAFANCQDLSVFIPRALSPYTYDNVRVLLYDAIEGDYIFQHLDADVSPFNTPISDFSADNIGWYLIAYIGSDKNLTLPEKVDGNAYSLAPGLFKGSDIQSVVLPNGLRSIGNQAFDGCTSLKNIEIPNTVTSIGNNAFYDCESLTSVVVPGSVTELGGFAFCGCKGLTSLIVKNKNIKTPENPDMFIGAAALKHISAPACVIGVRHDYYVYFNDLIPQKLESIEVTGSELSEEALRLIGLSRKTLQSLDLSSTAHTDLPDELFKEFYNMQSLKLPAGLTRVGYKAMAECVKLKAIDMPTTITEIDDRAFEDCRSLAKIGFSGKELRRIGNWAFYNAHALQQLSIPEGVEEIGDGAFYGCAYLEDLTLPASVRAIGDNGFSLCGKIKKIVVGAVVPPSVESKTFFEVSQDAPVYVPDESLGVYMSTPVWRDLNIQAASKMPEAIDYTSAADAPQKLIRDGQLFILRDGKAYTVQGLEMK